MGAVALVVGAQAAHAQSVEDSPRLTPVSDSASDTVREAPADRLSGRARVWLDASAERLEKGAFTAYGVSASFAPFVTEHLQLGIAPSTRVIDPKGGSSLNTLGSTVAARYIFGGDRHWRGFVGAFGGVWGGTRMQHSSQVGAQVGALYFLTPALAIRAGVDVRKGEPYFTSGQPRTELLYVALDPYAFGAADDVPVTPAGLGTLDIAGSYAYERLARVSESGISGTVAPYLTRWAQVGASGMADGSSQGITAHQLRGFGRLYLPLTARTQPFAEGFAETTTYNGEAGGLTSYGGAVGVRRMLNGSVAIDIGVERTLHPREKLGHGNFAHWYREAGGTTLVIGMMTRIGHAR
jgi:hypothetical protein